MYIHLHVYTCTCMKQGTCRIVEAMNDPKLEKELDLPNGGHGHHVLLLEVITFTQANFEHKYVVV